MTPETALPASDTDFATMQLQHMQHFADIGRLSAGMLHELSNPLTAAILSLEQYDTQPELSIRRTRRSLESMRRYIEAARQQIRQQSTVISFPVRPQLDQVRRIVGPLARRHNISLIIEPYQPCRLYGDPVKFQQIVANLIVNAIDAYQRDTVTSLQRPVRVRIETTGKFLLVRVTDWGEGIKPAHLAHVFEPFYSTKDHHTNHGLGIGLTIVKQYVTQDFRGSITVSSSPRRGTQFTIKLPLG
jgi:signal transduction histidine kinase